MPNKKANRPGRGFRVMRDSNGTLRVKYRELLTSVSVNSTQIYEFLPGATGMPHLDARAGLYEMYKIIGVRFIYKPAVGTSTNGEVLLGVDFDSRDIVQTYLGTAALQPKSTGPVWRAFGLRVPPERAMKQKWLLTSNLQDDAPARGAFTLQVTNTANLEPGTIWCEYHLLFASPRIPTRPTALAAIVVASPGGGTVFKRFTQTDPTISPASSSKDGFYVMVANQYDFLLQGGFTKEKIETVPSLSTVWSDAIIWRIIGPAATSWISSALSPASGTYGLATAFTVTALKTLAGIR